MACHETLAACDKPNTIYAARANKNGRYDNIDHISNKQAEQHVLTRTTSTAF